MDFLVVEFCGCFSLDLFKEGSSIVFVYKTNQIHFLNVSMVKYIYRNLIIFNSIH